jgi:hypothetical protein
MVAAMNTERCPKCGWPLPTILEFRAHLRHVERDEEHVQAVWSLLGIDYQAMRAEDRARAEELARQRGWRLL